MSTQPQFIPGEPSNRMPEKAVERLSPSFCPPGGEDNHRPPMSERIQAFLDTGTTVESFNATSRKIAKLLQNT